MAWAKSTTKTLTGATDDVTTDVFTSTKFNMVLFHGLSKSASADPAIWLGNTTIDTGTNYATRGSVNGGADGTDINQPYGFLRGDSQISGLDQFSIHYIINISSEEKLGIAFNTNNAASGAGTANGRGEAVYKWANTSNQFDIVQHGSSGTATDATDSNLTVLGTD